MSNNPYRQDFPILNEIVNDHPLVYLDNAATTQKPQVVIDAVADYYRHENANPHRGAYALSVRATEGYESARATVRAFIGAQKTEEIIFTRNATEALNLLAYSYGRTFLQAGDEIVLSIAEHHSNIVPWQQLAQEKGIAIRYLYVDEKGEIPFEAIQKTITEKTKIVSIAHVSNVLGTINPIKAIIQHAHDCGAVAIVDAAQSIPHMQVDVVDMDADFVVFSGHKMLAPMGAGVLYGKKELLERMPPFLTGGDMIEYVREQSATFAPLPQKFEAGTQNVEAALGLAAAMDYLTQIGMDTIAQIEHELTAYALEKMHANPYIRVFGRQDTQNRAGVISFALQDCHPHDVASILDADGVAIRSGHHCAHPLMTYLGVPATCRVSFYLYNTKEEIDQFIESLSKVRKWLGYGSE